MKKEKIKVKDLLIDPSKRYIDWEEDIKEYVDQEYLGEEHYVAEHMIVFKHNGGLWAFDDWISSEGETGLIEENGIDGEVEIYEVEAVPSVKYVVKQRDNTEK